MPSTAAIGICGWFEKVAVAIVRQTRVIRDPDVWWRKAIDLDSAIKCTCSVSVTEGSVCLVEELTCD